MNIFGQETTTSTPLESFETVGITSDIKDRIADLINEKDFVLLEVDNGAYSDEVTFYFLRHAQPDHWSYTCVVFEDKIYLPKDFESFLKDYKFLNKTNTLELFLSAYKQFYLNNSAIHSGYIVDKNYIEKNSESLKSYENGYDKLAFKKISAPTLNKKDNGDIKIKFYIDYPTAEKIQKNKISISSQYNFESKEKMFNKEKSVRID